MAIAFVLGNGRSRLAVDPARLAEIGPVYGCNALYREFTPTVLIATDEPIARAIQESRYAVKNRFYTRKPLPGLGAHRIPQKYFGFSSGPAAVGIAALDGVRHIYLLGFDLGPTESGGFNNIYADTEFYKKSTARPTYTGNWVRQLITVARDHATTTFFRVRGPSTADVADFRSIGNLAHMDLQDFQDRINNRKDL